MNPSQQSCRCEQCSTLPQPQQLHQDIRRLLDYVPQNRVAFFASQLDQLALFGEQNDRLLAQICQLGLGEIATLRDQEWDYAEAQQRRLADLADDDKTLDRLQHYFGQRLHWREQLCTEVKQTDHLKLKLRGRRLSLTCPASLESYLLVFEIFLSEPYANTPSVPLIYDLGANIGISALYFAALHPQAQLVCVEPLPENLDLLRQNLRDNGIEATVLPTAAATDDGASVFHKCPQARSLSSMFPLRNLGDQALGQLQSQQVSVECSAFRSIIQGRGYGLKLDIEGAEHGLVESPELIQRARWVVGELHLGPKIVPHPQAHLLASQLQQGFAFEMDGPGVFGDTVTYAFRAVAPLRLFADDDSPAEDSPVDDNSPADDWPNIVTLLSAQQDGRRSYNYPDPNTGMEHAVFPYEKRQEEGDIWLEFIQHAQTPLANPGIAIDAGCGLGVYTKPLSQHYRHVLAIDADKQRVQQAQDACGGSTNDLMFACLGLQDPLFFRPEFRRKLDLIHCIQVLGHIPIDLVQQVLHSFAGMLSPTGSVLLAVPFTNEPYDVFRVAELCNDGEVRGRSSDEREYQHYAQNSKQGVLPVRHFSIPSLHGALQQAGLKVVQEKPYNWFSYEHADLYLLAQKG